MGLCPMACLIVYVSSSLHFPINQSLILRKGIKRINEWGGNDDHLIVVWEFCVRGVCFSLMFWSYILRGVFYVRGGCQGRFYSSMRLSVLRVPQSLQSSPSSGSRCPSGVHPHRGDGVPWRRSAHTIVVVSSDIRATFIVYVIRYNLRGGQRDLCLPPSVVMGVVYVSQPRRLVSQSFQAPPRCRPWSPLGLHRHQGGGVPERWLTLTLTWLRRA